MSLVILKNIGYQEYKNSLDPKTAQDTEASHAASRQEIARKPGLQFAGAAMLLLLGVAVLSAYGTFLVLSAGDTHSLPAVNQLAAPAAAQPDLFINRAAVQVEETVPPDTLWRCGTKFTNTPQPTERCVFVGDVPQQNEGGQRFITPGAPQH